MTSPVPNFVLSRLPMSLPAGYAFVALTPEQQAGVARLGVILHTGDQPGLIVLREMLDARVVLGAVADADGHIQQFLELWCQDASGLASALPTYRQNLSNQALDERWRSRAKALARASAAGRFATGWEEKHAEPMFVDHKRLVPVRAPEKSGGPWALCEDDEFLRRHGKPAYSTSLSRYLYAPMQGDRSTLVPVAGPEALDAAGVAQAMGLSADAIPVSLGGLVLAVPLAPISFEQYVEALTGAGTEGSIQNFLQARASAGEVGRGPSILASGAGWLGPAAASPARRLPEVLHLKLRLLTEAIGIVRAMSAEGPLLNVSADTFRVHLAQGGVAAAGLPMWWTGRVGLATPGEAVQLPIPGSQTNYFLVGSDRLSIYSAQTLGASTQGRGVLRIRRVVDASLGSSGGSPPGAVAFGTMFECTLTTQERVSVGSHDLVWLRFSVGGTRVDTYAVAESKPGVAGAELRLRTLAMELPAGAAEKMTQAAGVPIPDAMFEVLPLLSTPSDMYSLGVLAVRTLFVNSGTSLPVALDETMSLANALAAEKAPEPGAEVGKAVISGVGRLLAEQKRYLDSLGCQRLLSEKIDPSIAAAMIPGELWHEVLAVVLRMFPATGWFSRCRDFGDAPAGAPDRIYDAVLDDFHALLTKTRSLIVADQGLSREVHQVVKELLVRV